MSRKLVAGIDVPFLKRCLRDMATRPVGGVEGNVDNVWLGSVGQHATKVINALMRENRELRRALQGERPGGVGNELGNAYRCSECGQSTVILDTMGIKPAGPERCPKCGMPAKWEYIL